MYVTRFQLFRDSGGVFSNRFAGLNSLESWLVHSPVHVLSNGNAAIHIFVVLSGFVIILPFTRPGSTAGWAPYYAKRLLRLYLPLWGSLVLAVVLMMIVPGQAPRVRARERTCTPSPQGQRRH
ncbi:acyltransferase family protein [Arthrobacter sp. LjRoot14]|uniref:acyltransferase family protein n=1 Tax=Arthrobacter sp. LjRoot14 TaxID=3342265 RepID=UPI003F50CC85